MSMASYNLLKAAADGLADAINYRTNLKRRRREEEYDYNKNWERNEQEYQRDIQRKKDWLDYSTDYDWKQMEKKDRYNRDKSLRYEKEDIDRKLGYLEQLPKDIDFYSPSSVSNANDVRGIYGFNPIAVQKKEKPYEQVLKEKEDALKLQLKYHNMQGQGDLARRKALADYQNALRMQNPPRSVRGGKGVGSEPEFWETPYPHAKELAPSYQNVVNARNKLSDYLRSKGFKQESEVMDKALDVLYGDYGDDEVGKEQKAKATLMFNTIMSRLDENDRALVRSYLTDLKNEVAFHNGFVSEKTNGRWGYDPNRGYYDVDAVRTNANSKGKNKLAELEKMDEDLSKVNPTVLSPSFVPIEQPTPPAVINNVDQQAILDSQKYLRGEMTAAQFQMLHPDYPLPTRQY